MSEPTKRAMIMSFPETMSHAEVAAVVGVSRMHVKQERGWHRRPDHFRAKANKREERYRKDRSANAGTLWTDADVDRAIKLYERGLSYNQIGTVIGRPRSAVAGKLDRLRRAGRLGS